ncbi:MAG: hypothetical protein K9K84_11750 [Methylovulum sp.]|nr:hypothetical protein [Methylovulum sp.]
MTIISLGSETLNYDYSTDSGLVPGLTFSNGSSDAAWVYGAGYGGFGSTSRINITSIGEFIDANGIIFSTKPKLLVTNEYGIDTVDNKTYYIFHIIDPTSRTHGDATDGLTYEAWKWTLATNNKPTGTVIINDTTPQQNQVLTVSNTLADVDGMGAVSYTWLANGATVGTGNSYTLTNNEVGKIMAVSASYTDGLGNNESVSSVATSAVTPHSVNPAFVVTKNDMFTGEDGDTAMISVSLATAPIRDVVITFSSSDITEGKITNSTLAFTSSNWSTPQNITVVGQNDYLNDGNQPYIISASVVSNDVNYRQLIIDPIDITNKEDVTTSDDARIPIGTSRDVPIKLYGDIQIDSSFQPISSFPANDVLNGLDGNDTLYGGNLQDDLSGGIGNDLLYGGNDQDFLYGQEGNDTLYGEQDSDYLDGGTGNDTLDGGLGLDTLIGGAGNDTYYLGYDATDVIDDQGLSTDIDMVIMPYQLTKYTLPTGIEKGAIAEGTQASSLTGNGSNNTLTGNDGSNTLSGAIGRDSLFGGLGNDVLNGGAGNDALTGGNGKDVFVLNTALTLNTDKIADFKPVDDTIKLENQIFTQLTATGTLDSSLFIKGTAAHDFNDYVIYNPTTGAVTYDSDGSGVGQGIIIAILGVNLPMTNADFVVI